VIQILGIFDEKQVKQMAETFEGEFTAKCVEKRRWCLDNGLAEQLDKDHAEVLKLLRMCGNAFHVEALRRLVLRDQAVPKWHHVEMLSNELMTEALT
jgi:hypothetical protein